MRIGCALSAGRIMEVTLCVLLWAHEGRDADLRRYEDEVLALLADHSGQVIQRAQTTGGQGSDDQPAEVQILQFASDDALDRYMHDPRRAALAQERDAAIARTDVLRVNLLGGAPAGRPEAASM
jgi:uncharacterized protein (DUF1330 family)